MKRFPQFRFGSSQNILLLFRKARTSAVDIEIEHRHRRLIWRALAPAAGLGRAFQRKRNPARVALSENFSFYIQRVAALRYFARPVPFLRSPLHFTLDS